MPSQSRRKLYHHDTSLAILLVMTEPRCLENDAARASCHDGATVSCKRCSKGELLVQLMLMHIKIGELCQRPNRRIDIHGGLHSGGKIVDGVDGHSDAVAAVGE